MLRYNSPMGCLLSALIFTLSAGPAAAYIGPGAGLGAIAVVLALAAGFLLLIVGLVWFPMKRLLKRKNANPAQKDGPGSK